LEEVTLLVAESSFGAFVQAVVTEDGVDSPINTPFFLKKLF
jgi:hypothetical protein